MNYIAKRANDHDHKLKLQGQEFTCYSKKKLDQLYPGGGYRIVGEVCQNNKEAGIAQVLLEKKSHKVSQIGGHSKLLYSRSGYICVGDDLYVAVLKNRLPFLLLLLGMLAALAIGCVLIFGGGEGPIVIQPDHPLPSVDDNSNKIEDDDSQKADVEEGGGSVSMIYTLKADLNLATGEIGIYFKNPNASSHDVAIELYIVSGENQYLVAQSGLVKAGYALDTLTLLEDAPQLSEGIYTGFYRLHCYDPISGEMALVAPEITGVEITVTE